MKFINLYMMGCLTLFFTSCRQKPVLIWEENFDGNTLNEAYWNYELGNGCPELCGWGNNEPQVYTKTNHSLKDGFLTISTKFEDAIYTSTRITTKNKFEVTYGRIEARAKLPKGQGIWPAFWMLNSNISDMGWPLGGEIDILEYIGKEPGVVYTTIHTKDNHGGSASTTKTKIENIEEGFHIFSVNWTSEKIDFFVDENLMYRYKPENKTLENWPFDTPFYILLNTAVGGNFGGPAIDNSIFPQDFIIDYVRVYKN